MSERLFLGFGSCVDYEVRWNDGDIERHAAELGIGIDEIDASIPVQDQRSLLRSILGFMRDGQGGERFVASSQVLLDFAARHPHAVTLGGSNVRAALALAQLGIESTVHLVSTDSNVRRLLPPSVTVICSATRDTLDPHLIIQYPAGASVELTGGRVVALHPNRLIYVNDPPNRDMHLHPALPDLIQGAKVVLLSGFNAMDDAQAVRDRAAEFQTAFSKLTHDAVIYYEDAGFHHDHIRTTVAEAFAGMATIHGMNEDELQGYVGRTVDLLDAGDVARALKDVKPHLIAPTVVLHTKYWALAHGPQGEHLRDALATGIDYASARFCFGDQLSPQALMRVREMPIRAESEDFATELEDTLNGAAVCIPARNLDGYTPTTIGLGDTFVGGFLSALA